jgi:hypothetical protein
MDEGRIFIGNLSKGKIGEENSGLLGSFLVSQFQLAAMQRADTREGERRDFHLYIDEFQDFTTDAFLSILSEARKYRLCLALGHQYISQLPESLRSAVFGNVGTMIALRVGYEDAEILADHFHPSGPNAMAPHAFSDLSQYEAWARIMRSGEVSDPFVRDPRRFLWVNLLGRPTHPRAAGRPLPLPRHFLHDQSPRLLAFSSGTALGLPDIGSLTRPPEKP